ncbi:MAG: hypothetical protein QF916_04790, partial [Gammaproteobacteria bacterium]|nr:hypothetical protein [Gammaproteobacteria bacterium]
MATFAQSHSKHSNDPSDSSDTGVSLNPYKITAALTAGLLLLAFTPRVQSNATLAYSVIGAALALGAWQIFQILTARWSGQTFGFKLVVRRQHYIQMMVQFSVYLYWGYYWRPVYDHLWLLAAQVLFAFSFDMLLSWSRKRDYTLGFGPIPIIFSTNLFMWFRDDWFYLQFLMIAVGFMGKEYVRWQREGRNVHIFNPSAFALGVFSLLLIATNTTSITWGQEIASTLTLAPNIYTFLFLIGLVVMYFFSITLVAGMAAITLFSFSALYSIGAGVPYFIDSDIPAAVFLGLHLLVTDPSTSPRTPLGKLVFGMLYGVGVFALYTLLDIVGAPTFYDKLLCVPLLNLSVIVIDRMVRSIDSEVALNLWKGPWFGGRGNLAHMSIWILVFGLMSFIGKTDGKHTGDSLPFWQQACADGVANSCERLVQLQSTYCGDNAGWACNELGILYRSGAVVEKDETRASA